MKMRDNIKSYLVLFYFCTICNAKLQSRPLTLERVAFDTDVMHRLQSTQEEDPLLNITSFSNEEFNDNLYPRNYKAWCTDIHYEKDQLTGRSIDFAYEVVTSVTSNISTFMLGFERVVHDDLVETFMAQCNNVEHMWKKREEERRLGRVLATLEPSVIESFAVDELFSRKLCIHKDGNPAMCSTFKGRLKLAFLQTEYLNDILTEAISETISTLKKNIQDKLHDDTYREIMNDVKISNNEYELYGLSLRNISDVQHVSVGDDDTANLDDAFPPISSIPSVYANGNTGNSTTIFSEPISYENGANTQFENNNEDSSTNPSELTFFEDDTDKLPQNNNENSAANSPESVSFEDGIDENSTTNSSESTSFENDTDKLPEKNNENSAINSHESVSFEDGSVNENSTTNSSESTSFEEITAQPFGSINENYTTNSSEPTAVEGNSIEPLNTFPSDSIGHNRSDSDTDSGVNASLTGIGNETTTSGLDLEMSDSSSLITVLTPDSSLTSSGNTSENYGSSGSEGHNSTNGVTSGTSLSTEESAGNSESFSDSSSSLNHTIYGDIMIGLGVGNNFGNLSENYGSTPNSDLGILGSSGSDGQNSTNGVTSGTSQSTEESAGNSESFSDGSSSLNHTIYGDVMTGLGVGNNSSNNGADGQYLYETSCPSRDANEGKEYVAETVSFSYSIESSLNPDEEQPKKKKDLAKHREYLIEKVEKVIHESQVNKWLKCLDEEERRRYLIRGNEPKIEFRYLTEATPDAIISAPTDEIAANSKCPKQETKDESDCFVVDAVFSIFFFVDNIDEEVMAQVQQAQIDSLSDIEQNMENDVYINETNANITDTSEEIIKLTFLGSTKKSAVAKFVDKAGEDHIKEKSRWRIGYIIPIVFLIIILIILCLICRRTTREEKHTKIFHYLPNENSSDTDETENGESDKSDKSDNIEIVYEEEGNRNDDHLVEVLNFDANSMHSSTSISSYSCETRHDLDVHKCSSGHCLKCRHAKPTTFIPIDLEKDNVSNSPKFNSKWWRGDLYV